MLNSHYLCQVKNLKFFLVYKSLLIMFTAELYSLTSFHSTTKTTPLLWMWHVCSCFHIIKHGVTPTWNSLSSFLPGYFPLILQNTLETTSGRISWCLSTSISHIVVWAINNCLLSPWCLEGNYYQNIWCMTFFFVFFVNVSVSPY